MASYKRLKEIGEYNYTREFRIDDKIYRIVVLYGEYLVTHTHWSEPEPIAQAFIVKESKDISAPSKVIGQATVCILREDPGPEDALEDALNMAITEAGFSTNIREYLCHWMLGETVPLTCTKNE